MQFCVKNKLLNKLCFLENIILFDKCNIPLVNKSNSEHFYNVTKKSKTFFLTIIRKCFLSTKY